MSWINVKYCSDSETSGSEESIDDCKWTDEDHLSDEKIEHNKQLIRHATDKQNLFKFLLSSSRQPVNPSSNRIKLAQKISSVKRRRKSLEGFYETIPEVASIVKISDFTVVTLVPGPDTEVHKADFAKFGTL